MILNEIEFLTGMSRQIDRRIDKISQHVEPEPERIYNTVILIDCGHGGLNDNGHYTTAPSKMSRHPGLELHNGPEFYEGVFNREVGKALFYKLKKQGIPVRYISEKEADVSLTDRTNRANIIAMQEREKGRKTVYFSIHGNANGYGDPQDKAEGFSIFVHPGASSASVRLAESIGKYVRELLPDMNYRYGSEKVNGKYVSYDYWKSNLHVLRETAMPAVLSENGFFDHSEEVKDMIKPEFIEKIAQAHFLAALAAQD